MPQITPSKRAISTHVSGSVDHSWGTANRAVELTPSKLKPPTPSIENLARYNETSKPTIRPGGASQTLAARPSKQRPSVQSIFAKPLPKPRDKPGSKPTKDTIDTRMSSQTSSESAGPRSTLSKASTSSAALRETIAKAKAARRRIGQLQDADTVPSTQVTDDFPEIDFGNSNRALLRKRVASARLDGRLNIAAMGLKEMPSEVMNLYNADTFEDGDGAWYESVDLVRLVAADNEFEKLDKGVFPDTVIGVDSALDDDLQGMLFAGLDTLDLHGNHLHSLPLGLRRLQRLTTLNLSKNQIGNESLEIITQIRSLRELRLADNALDGVLTPQLGNLDKLETLDLSNNAVTALQPNSDKNAKLRVLNVAGNKMSSLPLELLASLPLIEINAARNRLGGVLFPTSVSGFLDLKTLDVASNALTSIVESRAVELPSLQSLNITDNRLTQMPEMSGWTELDTLVMSGNRLASLPESINSLKKLRNVDFSRNDIKRLDERLGLMDNLTTIRIANNPLRERKFLTMDTDSIKRELRSRVLPEECSEGVGDDIMSCQGDRNLPRPHP